MSQIATAYPALVRTITPSGYAISTNDDPLSLKMAIADYYQNLGTKYVLPPEAGEQEDNKHPGVVIAEKPTEIETLTVSEAVMKMDLQDLPALMFFNSAHGGINVVYRRTDGNISWVDPQENAA